jgi:uncharacterized protein
VPRPAGSRRRRTLATVLRWTAAALVVLAVVSLVAAGWYFSDLLIRPTPNRPLEAGLIVSAVDDSSITLSGSAIARKGRTWFLEWPGGSAIAGELIASDGAHERRRLRLLEGRIAAGDRVDLRAYLYAGDPLRAHGLPFEVAHVGTELGHCLAWAVPGPRMTWVVFVHGMKAGRGEALRLLPAVHALGLTSLTISYRNDPNAPRAHDGLFHLGATEWKDLEAGVRFALQNGARHVVLAGYSMGGAMIAEFMRRSALADSVAGVVLDSPVLDWDAVVDLGAQKEGGLAPYLAPLAKRIVTLRTGFRWASSGAQAWPRQFRTSAPVLVFHGTADNTVPFARSEAFAQALGKRVTLVSGEGAGHIQSWNFDPAGYDSTLSRWLTQVAPD